MAEARYRIVGTIGRGGMGEVCLADDLMLDRQIALKFLAPTAREDNALDQLLAEARAAAALDHPFICSVYEVTSLDDRPCIAMEYVRGETLERRLRRGALALGDALRVADEIAEAMEAAHKRRVIHRDLKPANVMLTDDQHIKVMDFGLAARLSAGDGLTDGPSQRRLARDESVEIRGTPAYMAPEQIRGEHPDRRSDIFAFGILLYQLLSGVHPFLRTGVDATLAAILGEPAVDLRERMPAISPPLAALVERMLAKEPSARQPSFAEVRRELRMVAAALSVSTVSAPAPEAARAHGEASAGLIGRSAERAQLLQCITEAKSGSGGLVVLTGEAGLGKTKLAEEALEHARRCGCLAWVGRCYEQDGTPPLIPYIELLEAASRLMPAHAFLQAIGAGAPELAKLLPELHRLVPDMAAPLELPPSLRQRFLFTNVRDFLARASRVAPLVVLLDDLQWADEATLQLTEYLAQHLAALPLLVIAVGRDAEAPAVAAKGALQHLFDRVRGQGRDELAAAPAKLTLDRLLAQGRARAVTLRPLTESEVRALLSALARRDAPARLARQFLDQTGGNPLFVAELFRHLQEEGRLFDAAGRWKSGVDVDDIDVPASVRAVIDRRIQRVSRETQSVLRTAAVIGGQFDLDLLETVAGVDDDALMSALDEAEHARLVKGPSGRQDVRWRFTHELIRQTLVHGMARTRRQRLHVSIAAALERLEMPSRPNASEIAHHLYAAGPMADARRTADALTAAGDAAHAIYATEEAMRHYRRALEVIGEGGGDEAARLRIEERLADLLALVGDRGTAMTHYQRIEGVHAIRQARVDLARVSRKIGTLHWQSGDRVQAMACFDRALRALEGAETDVEAAHVYHELGLAAFRSGDNQQAIDWAVRALTAAEQALAAAASLGAEARREATRAIAHATNTIGVALARTGEFDAARDRIERSVTAAREVGLLDVACRAYANLGVLYSTVEPQRAIDVSLTGLELASRIGAASLQSYIYANLAAAYCALTDRCESEGLEAARAAADLDRQLGQLDHLAVPLIVMAQIHQCRGELLEAQQHYAEALALAERASEPQLIVPCYDGLATIALDRGDRAAATAYMERARALCHRTGLDPDTLLLLPFLS